MYTRPTLFCPQNLYRCIPARKHLTENPAHGTISGMKPFFQGKLDVFCALYAVLNGLKITHNIGVLPARDILHDTLMHLAEQPEVFRAVLEQRTDYVPLVDTMLSVQCKTRPLHVEQPFPLLTTAPQPSGAHVFARCAQWLAVDTKHAIILRFLRYLTPDAPPVNRHWTTAHLADENSLHLFDCSHEAGAIYSIPRKGFVTHTHDISKDCLLCIEPASIRFIRPSF